VKEVSAAIAWGYPANETQALREATARSPVGIVMGICERVRNAPGHGTLFNCMLYFAEDGRMVNHHAKLIPTYSEQMV
jgi:nitrilase